MMIKHARTVLAALGLVLSPVGFAVECTDPPKDPGIDAFCGIVAPEDLVLLEDHSLIVSSMTEAQHLYRFDLASDTLAPMETRLKEPADGNRWGDPACPVPDFLVTHGLDISRRDDGAWQLLAVNHGAQESIEYFSIEYDTSGEPALQWRGCVLAGKTRVFNDVAGLPDGGFLATDPLTASRQFWNMLRGAFFRARTGQVYRWQPGAGYEGIEQTRGPYPNGILMAADGESFYLNMNLGDKVIEYDLESGEPLRRVKVQGPDNSSLAEDGSLLVASHDASMFKLLGAVRSPPDKRNEIAYEIIRIDPETFEASVHFRSEGEPLGGGTVAQEFAGDLYIGAFRGDRIIRVRAPDAP